VIGTLAYNGAELITTVKSFIVQTSVHEWKFIFEY